MKVPARFLFKSNGPMSYEVRDKAKGTYYGYISRNADGGWMARPVASPGFEVFASGRDVAAGLLAQAFEKGSPNA